MKIMEQDRQPIDGRQLLISPLAEYSRACTENSSYDELVWNAEIYIEAQLKGLGININDIPAEFAAVVDPLLHSIDKRQAIEHFLLLPIRLAPYIEKTGIAIDDLKEWYWRATLMAIGGVPVLLPHNRDCHDEGSENNEECAYSVTCPHRATKNALLKDLVSPEFDSSDYQQSIRVGTIAYSKAWVAVHSGLIQSEEADMLFKNYITLHGQYYLIGNNGL